ncbi:hypothetical protein ABZP36_027603 [Zizania latifolia]
MSSSGIRSSVPPQGGSPASPGAKVSSDPNNLGGTSRKGISSSVPPLQGGSPGAKGWSSSSNQGGTSYSGMHAVSKGLSTPPPPINNQQPYNNGQRARSQRK